MTSHDCNLLATLMSFWQYIDDVPISDRQRFRLALFAITGEHVSSWADTMRTQHRVLTAVLARMRAQCTFIVICLKIGQVQQVLAYANMGG